jgi:hypothetical protein
VRGRVILEDNEIKGPAFFWDVTQYSQLKVNRRFGGTWRLHLQGRRISQARNQSEAGKSYMIKLYFEFMQNSRHISLPISVGNLTSMLVQGTVHRTVCLCTSPGWVLRARLLTGILGGAVFPIAGRSPGPWSRGPLFVALHWGGAGARISSGTT